MAANGGSYETILYRVEEGIAFLTLNRPEVLNALNRQMTRVIIAACQAMNEDPEVAADAMRHWASGYLLKKSAGSELIKAIREVLKGNSYVTPKVAQQLLDRFVRDPRPEYSAKLTSRQREVLQLLAEGKSMKEAADILHITPRTIAFHKYRIMEEFGLRTNSDLMVFAIREHLISA